jgi:hypothetical protein
MGGYNSPCDNYLKSCEKYNILEDKWTPMPEMIQKKAAFSALYYQQKLLYFIQDIYSLLEALMPINV